MFRLDRGFYVLLPPIPPSFRHAPLFLAVTSVVAQHLQQSAGTDQEFFRGSCAIFVSRCDKGRYGTCGVGGCVKAL